MTCIEARARLLPSALTAASTGGHIDIVRILLEAGKKSLWHSNCHHINDHVLDFVYGSDPRLEIMAMYPKKKL